jgi:hypothetical protein
MWNLILPFSLKRRRTTHPNPLLGKARGLDVNVAESSRRSHFHSKKGQSMLESALVLVMASIVLFGMIQVALVVHGWQVQQGAAFHAARSRVVGFNDGVVEKAWFVGSILNAGKMRAPQTGLWSVQQSQLEASAIPLFFDTAGSARALAPQLDYEGWDNLGPVAPFTVDTEYTAIGEMKFPLVLGSMIPLLGATYGHNTNLVFETAVKMENHFPLYLEVD